MPPQDQHGAGVAAPLRPFEPKVRLAPGDRATRLAVELASEHVRVSDGPHARALVVGGSVAATRSLQGSGALVDHVETSSLAETSESFRWIADDGAYELCLLVDALEDDSDPSVLLADAYRALRPEGLLVLTGDDWRRKRGAGSVRRDALQNLLFREGFEKPRLRTVGRRLVVSARRSALAPPTQRQTRLSVILPVFNERSTFRTTMDALLAKSIPGMEIEIVLVESNSTDGTRDDALLYADHPRVDLVLEDRPQGKGHAVRVGLSRAKGDFVLIQDADLEYDIDDYDGLLEPLRKCEAGFVLGFRVSPDGQWGMRRFGPRNLTSSVMNVGHLLFLALFNTVYGQRLKDPFTMYKVFRRDCIHGLNFECNRFDFDWELVGKLVRAGYTPIELPARYHSRSFAEGKKVSFFGDPWTWVVACFKYRFSRLYR